MILNLEQMIYVNIPTNIPHDPGKEKHVCPGTFLIDWENNYL